MKHALTHIDLFTGIGGFALAAQWAGFETVAFCEIDDYCRELIKQRFGAVSDAEIRGQSVRGRAQGHGRHSLRSDLPPEIYGDIRTLVSLPEWC